MVKSRGVAVRLRLLIVSRKQITFEVPPSLASYPPSSLAVHLLISLFRLRVILWVYFASGLIKGQKTHLLTILPVAKIR